jgi:hypothetical protein
MDLGSFVSQVDASEAGSCPEPYDPFTFYHPQYQPEFSAYQDSQYASFILIHREESAHHRHSVSKFLFGSNPGLLKIATLIIQSDELPDQLRPKWRIHSTHTRHSLREDVDIFRINAARRGAQVSGRVVSIPTGTNLSPFRSGPPFL